MTNIQVKNTRAIVRYISALLIGGFILYVLLKPNLYYPAGNIFFGEVPYLYNVELAQFFFTRASHPYIGNSFPYAQYQLSRTYFIQGDFDNALREAQAELEMFPEHIHTYYILGLTLGYMGREEEAVDAFGKFIEHKPGSWAARNDRAWLQFRIGDIDGALETLEPVAMITSNPWIQNTYGTLLMNKIKYSEARKAFENAQLFANQLTEEEWGRTYPGNDPRIYALGLEEMRSSIEKNLEILNRLD